MKQQYILIAAAAAIPFAASAQQQDSNLPAEKSIIETITKIEKKTDAFNLFLNMHGDFAADWTGSTFNGGKFQMKQLRIEAKGRISDHFSYRYRQRLNKGENPNGYVDNLWKGIDVAGIGMNFGKWDFFFGKQCAAYGGIEFDLNPIEIYEYSDMVENMTNFMTGVNIAYNITPRQQLQFQILNSLVDSSEKTYGAWEKSKLPLVYTLNWNGNFNDVYKTRWSASVMNETKDKYMYYFALGNDFNITDKLGAYFDWMYSIEGVDRKGIITGIVGGNDPVKNSSRADYMSFVLHLNYRFAPHWNIFAKGMYETAGVGKTHFQDYNGSQQSIEKGNYRTSWGYIGGIEYYPFNDRNLHFFCTYVGRHYNYSWRAAAFGKEDYNTNRVSLGFIWQMPVF